MSPPLPLSAGQMIDFRCNYMNNEDHTISQGRTTRDEMCMFIGLYYPKDTKTELCSMTDDWGGRYLGANWIGNGTAGGLQTAGCLQAATGASAAHGDADACVVNACPAISAETSNATRCLASQGLGQCATECGGTDMAACRTCVGEKCTPAMNALGRRRLPVRSARMAAPGGLAVTRFASGLLVAGLLATGGCGDERGARADTASAERDRDRDLRAQLHVVELSRRAVATGRDEPRVTDARRAERRPVDRGAHVDARRAGRPGRFVPAAKDREHDPAGRCPHAPGPAARAAQDRSDPSLDRRAARRTTERARPKLHTRVRVGVRNGEKAGPGTGRGVAQLSAVNVAPAFGAPPLPPGPRGSVVQMLRYARDPLGFYADCARRFGDVFTVPTVLGPLVVCGDPEGVRAIFALPPDSFSRWSTESVSPLLGEASLLLSGGARHARDRKLLTPPFHGERMRAYGAVMRAAALREAASWAPGSVFSMQEAGSAISIDVILRAVFGIDEAAGLDELRAAVLGALASMSPLLMLFPALRRRLGGIGPYARMLRVRDRLDALIYDAIARAAGPRR